ncbi:MAG: hypothetical protein OXC93_05555, partial [Rhodospirillaceae bacterium]|nr:hypothetical protein [Rhodospirillaceae bacterium]
RRPGPAHPALGRDRRGDQSPRRVRQIVCSRPGCARVAALQAMGSSFVGLQTPDRGPQREATRD